MWLGLALLSHSLNNTTCTFPYIYTQFLPSRGSSCGVWLKTSRGVIRKLKHQPSFDRFLALCTSPLWAPGDPRRPTAPVRCISQLPKFEHTWMKTGKGGTCTGWNLKTGKQRQSWALCLPGGWNREELRGHIRSYCPNFRPLPECWEKDRSP